MIIDNAKLRFAASILILTLMPSVADARAYQHSLGSVNIESVPERVVVLGYGSLDYIHALGIDPVGLPKSLLPEWLNQYENNSYKNTGSSKEVNYETLFSLKPDLIIAEGRLAEIYPDLADIAPTYIFRVDTKDYWQSTKRHWTTLATIFNKQNKAIQLITQVEERIKQLQAKVKNNPLRTLAIANNGSRLAMFNENSRFSFVYNEASFAKSTSQTVKSSPTNHGNLISFEYIADAQPEALLILDREHAIGRSSGKAKSLFNNDLVNSTPAAKNDRIVFVDPATWYLAAGGYQATHNMITELNDIISL